MQYTIKEKAENIKDSLIEKLGVVVTFSLTEVEAHEAQLNKVLKELIGQSVIEKAKMTNIENNHPFVLDMSEQDMFTCHMYQEAKAIFIMAGKKIEEIEAQISTYAVEKEEIKKQCPELADVVSPYQNENV